MSKIQAYPLIYSATKSADYVPDGIVRPNNINTEKASKYMIESMNNIKYLEGSVRHCVFGVDNYIVYGGTACVPSKLIPKICKEEIRDTLNLDYENYLTDKFGRPMICFIGFAVRRSDIPKGMTIKLSLYQTYKTYIDYLKNLWDEPVIQAKLLSSEDKLIDLELTEYKENFNPEITSYNDEFSFIKNFEEDNYKPCIDYFFNEMVNNPNDDKSFLSGVFPDDVTSNNAFRNVSLCEGTPEKCIERINSESLNKEEITIYETKTPSKEAEITSGVVRPENYSNYKSPKKTKNNEITYPEPEEEKKEEQPNNSRNCNSSSDYNADSNYNKNIQAQTTNSTGNNNPKSTNNPTGNNSRYLTNEKGITVVIGEDGTDNEKAGLKNGFKFLKKCWKIKFE